MDHLALHSAVVTMGVVGASARAAMHSIARAGYRGWAVDLFADRDLKRLAPCELCPWEKFPAALPALIERFPHGPILYTGGLENHPEIIAQLADKRPLLGNSANVLNHVRNPFFVHSLPTKGMHFPQLIPPGDSAPNAGRWLRKPLRSSSGHGIRLANANEPASRDHYFQEFVEGTSMSALFVSDGREPNSTVTLGVTEQLIGVEWLHAGGFAYCGNIGPIELPRPVEASLFINGKMIGNATALGGLWGMDFILHENAISPVELNPRYTAAIEVLELGAKFSSLMSHYNCFTSENALAKMKWTRRFTAPIGKAIYYAPHRIVFPSTGPWDGDLAEPFDPWRVPSFADIPEPDAVIESGSPVLTIFARSDTAMDCRKKLQARAAELDRLFAEARL